MNTGGDRKLPNTCGAIGARRRRRAVGGVPAVAGRSGRASERQALRQKRASPPLRAGSWFTPHGFTPRPASPQAAPSSADRASHRRGAGSHQDRNGSGRGFGIGWFGNRVVVRRLSGRYRSRHDQRGVGPGHHDPCGRRGGGCCSGGSDSAGGGLGVGVRGRVWGAVGDGGGSGQHGVAESGDRQLREQSGVQQQ
jgi:hypothetical protein